jgi:shikimate kinase
MKAPHLKHIFLTGFMGAGKSRVGKLLAGLLRRPLREMDQELARRFNMPIAQVFAQRGESVFRAAESKWLQKIMQEPKPCIISTGGGAVVSAVSRRLMDAGGGRVFIDVPLAVLEQRMNREESELRPLWRSRAERAQLWQNRYPLYNSAALSVNGAQAAEAVAREIAGYFMPVMEAEIKAMGRACRLRTVSWEIIGQAAAAVSSGRNFMLLDAALQDEAGHWREHGFQVQVMRRRGEALKTWPSACGVLRALQQQALARDDFMLVRGGGSLSDMGGFCAGIYKRGINLVLIATTLLAAADAAVGGTTALNFGP